MKSDLENKVNRAIRLIQAGAKGGRATRAPIGNLLLWRQGFGRYLGIGTDGKHQVPGHLQEYDHRSSRNHQTCKGEGSGDPTTEREL